MTRKRKIVVIVSALVLVAAVGCSREKQEPVGSLTVQETSVLVESLVGAPIPQGATDIHGRKVSVFTTCIDVRFSCSQEQLKLFLEASSRLPDMLDPNEKSLTQMQNNIPWWKPDSLTDTKGLSIEWKDGTDIVSCYILAGKEPDGNQTVVYLLFVLESEKTRSTPATEPAGS